MDHLLRVYLKNLTQRIRSPQTSPASLNKSSGGGRRFLGRMEVLIPWERLLEKIRPYYPKAGKGRAPYELEPMECIVYQWPRWPTTHRPPRPPRFRPRPGSTTTASSHNSAPISDHCSFPRLFWRHSLLSCLLFHLSSVLLITRSLNSLSPSCHVSLLV